MIYSKSIQINLSCFNVQCWGISSRSVFWSFQSFKFWSKPLLLSIQSLVIHEYMSYTVKGLRQNKYKILLSQMFHYHPGVIQPISAEDWVLHWNRSTDDFWWITPDENGTFVIIMSCTRNCYNVCKTTRGTSATKYDWILTTSRIPLLRSI